MNSSTLQLNPLINILGPLVTALDEMLESSSSSSSDESDCEKSMPKYINFIKSIDEFNCHHFKSHMRLLRSTVEYLIIRYEEGEIFLNQRNVGKIKVSAKEMIYIYIWYVSNTITYRQLANLFGSSKSTAWNIVRRIVFWLLSIGDEFINWPTGAAAESICKKFKDKKKIDGILGAIDGTHITIKAPSKHKESYFNRKQTYSIALQAVVDANKKFINVYCGEPGSLHDSRVLKRSELYHRSETNKDALFSNSTFLLGDSAYSNYRWLVTPFRDNGNLTPQQKKFNKMHSSARIVVENAFGLWKGRFRRVLKFTENRDLKGVGDIIISTCILHNICIIREDNLSIDEYEQTEDSETNAESTDLGNDDNGANRRDILFNSMIQ